jgi:hypothetical protein
MFKIVNISHKIMTILLICWKVLLCNFFSNLIAKLHVDIFLSLVVGIQGDENMPKEVDYVL